MYLISNWQVLSVLTTTRLVKNDNKLHSMFSHGYLKAVDKNKLKANLHFDDPWFSRVQNSIRPVENV